MRPTLSYSFLNSRCTIHSAKLGCIGAIKGVNCKYRSVFIHLFLLSFRLCLWFSLLFWAANTAVLCETLILKIVCYLPPFYRACASACYLHSILCLTLNSGMSQTGVQWELYSHPWLRGRIYSFEFGVCSRFLAAESRNCLEKLHVECAFMFWRKMFFHLACFVMFNGIK